MSQGENYGTIFVYIDFVCVFDFSLEKLILMEIPISNYQYMNVRLEKLFLQHHLSYKDCYEIQQIYQFLSPTKRQNLIDNFDVIVQNIQKLKHDIGLEQEVILWEAFTEIEQTVSQIQKKQIHRSTSHTIEHLKRTI